MILTLSGLDPDRDWTVRWPCCLPIGRRRG
jgi:hypothetical protein